MNPAGPALHRWKTLVSRLIVVACKNNLLDVVAALHAARRFTSCLNGWEQQTYQDPNNRNND
jgi:hypothetical protein